MSPPDDPKREKRLARLERARNLTQLSPKRLLEALIDAEDAGALARSLPSDQLYYAIAEVGLSDAADVVQLASPTQFKAFVDLGGWEKDRVDPKRVLAWLESASVAP